MGLFQEVNIGLDEGKIISIRHGCLLEHTSDWGKIDENKCEFGKSSYLSNIFCNIILKIILVTNTHYVWS